METSNKKFIFPRILHLYWNGPLPFLNYLTIVSFIKYHPNWKINVYVTTKINNTIKWITGEQKYKIECHDYMDEVHQLSINHKTVNIIDTSNLCEELKLDNLNYTYQSDILRMYFLKEVGGLWSDFDIIYTKNIEDAFCKYETDICFRIKHTGGRDYYYPIGLLLGKGKDKDSIVYDKIFNEQIKLLRRISINYQKFGVFILNNMFNTSNDLDKVRHSENTYKVTFLGQEYYLPYVYTDLYLLFDRLNSNKITQNTIGVHWFNGANKSRKYVNMIEKIDPNNFKIRCTMDALISPYMKYKK